MRHKTKVILIGGIHLHNKPTCGETMKNQLFLKRFNELFEIVVPIDTYHWQKRPWCLVELFFVLLFNPKAKVIISGSGASKHLINFLYRFPVNKHAYFWVVGGDLPVVLRKGLYSVKALNNLVFIPVQGQSMVEELKELGVNNAIYVPNSRPILYHPTIERHDEQSLYRFVFLSRIHPDKGFKEIREASELLDAEGYKGQYTIDFYGTKADDFAEEFDSMVNQKENWKYKGYLDLTTKDGYVTLSSYDMMLFPTYWRGEGFPGVVLDANIAGVPIIASDWNLNTEVIEHNKTGIIIPTHNSTALFEAMKRVITGGVDLYKMKCSCVQYVQQYDYREVLSEELMKRLGLFD